MMMMMRRRRSIIKKNRKIWREMCESVCNHTNEPNPYKLYVPIM
jgi:hypothetical protein